MFSLTPKEIGRGWAQLAENAEIRALDQWLNVNKTPWRWQIGFFFKKDGMKVTYRVPYRRPISIWARLVATCYLPRKLWMRVMAKVKGY